MGIQVTPAQLETATTSRKDFHLWGKRLRVPEFTVYPVYLCLEFLYVYLWGLIVSFVSLKPAENRSLISS
jgi:hypothetical protein